MSLNYYDRDEVPISRGRWHELSAQPDYQSVKRSPTAAGTVETTWCGLVCGSERKPTLFAVRVLGSNGKPDPVSAYQWFRTRDAALHCHEQMVAELEAKAEQGKGELL